MLGLFLTGKFNQQQGLGLALHEAIDYGRIHGNIPGQVNHGAIHQLNCRGIEFDDVLSGIHRLVKTGKVTHAQHLMFWYDLQIQVYALEESECAFRSYQQVRHVRFIFGEYVDVVTTHSAQQIWKALRYLRGLSCSEIKQFVE